jgi:hypothetical protein
MIVYCNNDNLNNNDYDIDSVNYDDYIYLKDGIYKKYKKHFFKLDICNNIKKIKHGNFNFFIQEQENTINKNKIITYIPFNNFYVSRKTIKYKINDDLFYVKEIDNDVFINEYYIINNIDNLCLHLKNNI